MPQQIDGNDHFARQCSRTRWDYDDQGREWIKGEAFRPTPENPNVSGLWIENHQGSWQKRLASVKCELGNSERSVNANHRLAILLIGRIAETGDRYNRSLSVIHTPNTVLRLPSHSEIVGIQPQDRILQQKIADQATIESAA